MATVNRRELKTRSRAWPKALARGLGRAGATPNAISVASVVFAAAAAGAFCVAGVRHGRSASLWFVLAAAGIQLRLLCNMLDGLLAIEGGLKSPTGDLYNEVPDRLADILILINAGVAIAYYQWWLGGIWLGVAATIAALLTAYVRLLGGSLGLPQDFRGPMAKQHRMFTLTVGALVAAVEQAMNGSAYALVAALLVIIIGSALTFVLRLGRIARALERR
jgi:phosphatidylglycerophosphate synthase